MIKGNATASDAARQLGISIKTLNSWIARWVNEGLISEPPKFKDGLRDVRHFPIEYIAKLDALRNRHAETEGNVSVLSSSKYHARRSLR